MPPTTTRNPESPALQRRAIAYRRAVPVTPTRSPWPRGSPVNGSCARAHLGLVTDPPRDHVITDMAGTPPWFGQTPAWLVPGLAWPLRQGGGCSVPCISDACGSRPWAGGGGAPNGYGPHDLAVFAVRSVSGRRAWVGPDRCAHGLEKAPLSQGGRGRADHRSEDHTDLPGGGSHGVRTHSLR
jgi:hypothetical protein